MANGKSRVEVPMKRSLSLCKVHLICMTGLIRKLRHEKTKIFCRAEQFGKLSINFNFNKTFSCTTKIENRPKTIERTPKLIVVFSDINTP